MRPGVDGLHVEAGTVRQDSISAVYKLDGSEVAVASPPGLTERARAMVNGETIVVTAKRTFSSPAGEIVIDIKDVYSVAGATLTVERSVTSSGDTNTAKAAYNKQAP